MLVSLSQSELLHFRFKDFTEDADHVIVFGISLKILIIFSLVEYFP